MKGLMGTSAIDVPFFILSCVYLLHHISTLPTMDNILDDLDFSRSTNRYHEAIEYWESFRFYYNVALGIACLFALLFLPFAPITTDLIRFVLFGGIAYVIAANICYCFGWGLEILILYYSPSTTLLSSNRHTLWTIVVAGTIIFTLLLSANLFIVPYLPDN